ncbi:MAG TPA: NAD(P)-binding domain-containing protein [Candidatus Sulfotelmatobacter sp.]|nr:NAD(P)-binding domain-containing protein [Candidatus Sulfotelmatobacter sp.]
MRTMLFLGGGRITGALAAGLRLAGDKRVITVYDRHPDKLRVLRRESRVEIVRDLKSAVRRAEMMVLAVRPSSAKELLREVSDCGALPEICVSLAAGIPLKNLKSWLPSPARWARAMPSPVCRIGRGLTALCFDRRVSSSDREKVRKMFERVGQVVEVPESSFDAFTATYSSSHGYHALATLAHAAQDAGLDGETALIAAAHAVADGIQYWKESGLSLEELLEEAATPGGIASTTMKAMNRAGYVRAVNAGLRAGIAQATKNAKQ